MGKKPKQEMWKTHGFKIKCQNRFFGGLVVPCPHQVFACLLCSPSQVSGSGLKPAEYHSSKPPQNLANNKYLAEKPRTSVRELTAWEMGRHDT
jgi:hypothetical protein